MRGLGIVRDQRLRRQTEADARPPRRDVYVSQKRQVSYNEISKMTVDDADPIQNVSGTFLFMAGYDR